MVWTPELIFFVGLAGFAAVLIFLIFSVKED